MQKIEELYPEQLRQDPEKTAQESRKDQNGSPFSFREMDDFNFEAPIVFNFVGPEN